MPTLAEAFAQAVTFHRAGQLPRAEFIYRQILEVDPNHAEAWHLLGMVAHQTGQSKLAAEFIRRAIELNPRIPAFHSNLGLVYQALKNLPDAIASYQRALELQPDYAVAHNNLGNALKEQGRLIEAAASYRNALELKPDFAEAHNGLGIVCKEQGTLDEAIACYRRALALKPEYVEAHSNLGNALQDAGQVADAVACYRRALELRPNFPEAHYNLAKAQQDQGQLADAVAGYRRALELKPDFAEADHRLGTALQLLDQLDEAIACYRRALARKPGFAAAHLNLGTALQHQGQLTEAVACYRRTLDLQPDHAEAHFHLGNARRAQGQLDDAAACFQQALDRKPDYIPALVNLGTARQDQGRVDEAIACYQRVLELQPDHAEAHSNLGVALLGQGKADEALESFRRAATAKPDWLQPRSHLAFALNYCPGYDARRVYEELQRWVTSAVTPRAEPGAFLGWDRTPERRLRVGYVSPDFRQHCQAHFTVPVFAAHDHRNFEFYYYADVACPDEITARLRSYADVWRPIVGLPDDRIAELVRADQIDILVDLTMHMAQNHLGVFARRSAPVQVCWLAYPGTTGLTTIDYRLTDPSLDPPGLFDGCYAEESLRLPDSFWCYDPLAAEPAVNELPALTNGYITFGSLNNFCKVNDGVLSLWAPVLRAVADSRLLLLAPEGAQRQRTRAWLERAGIAGERVSFVSRQPRRQYLERYHQIDIGLDTLPANGHTTSLDAYWMGVPVVTIVGATVMGRAGVSQLTNLGLRELLADTPEQFVAIAVGLARDRPRLRELRATFRSRLERSPLMDAPRFTRHLEAAYREMWRRWCARQPG